MLFSNKLKAPDVSEVYMNNIKIPYVSSARFLGLIIDDQLKFNLHFNSIAQKIAKNCGILYKLRQYVPTDTLLCVYRSFVESYLNYCTLIFGHAYPTHIRPLEVAQRKCIRIIANQPHDAHSNPIFSQLKLLKFSDIYKYNIGTYMFKNLEKFSSHILPNPYSTRSGIYYAPTNQRLTLTKNQSLKFQGPSNWNIIPDDLKNSTSINIFKRKYKKLLLSSYSE